MRNQILGPYASNIDAHTDAELARGTQSHRAPRHYQILPGIEQIDIRDALLQKIAQSDRVKLSLEQVDYWSRSWEYLTRFMDKGGVDDLHKSYAYLHRLLFGRWPA